jgi:hypothetical protein
MTVISERNRLRDQLRRLTFAPGEIKTAELGGGQDAPFEQAFSNLAHSYIRDKAPKLLDYEIGFQLIEKNQDNTKAVGVFGFKLGHQMLYAPVFFLNGDLKGHELLYVKQQDAFIPLKENWINYLMGRKPSALGEGLNRNLSLVGVMPPNLYQLSRSPNKFASDQSLMPKVAGWLEPVLPDFAYFAVQDPAKDPKFKDVKTLPDFLKEAGEPMFRFLVEKVAMEYPAILQAIDACYGPQMLTDMARSFVKKAEEGRSILKQATVAAAGETPPGWNGRFEMPSVRNGGVQSYGKEAWDGAQQGRRRTGAQIGHLEDMQAKQATSPSCGTTPMKPKTKKAVGPVKQASLMENLEREWEKEAKPASSGPAKDMKDKQLKVVTLDEVKDGNRVDLIHNLSSDERETLLKERIIVKDTRDDKDVTTAYNAHGPVRLMNPNRTNIYNILVRPDKFEKCLVVFGPYCEKGSQTFCTCISLSSKRWCNIHPSRLWSDAEYDDEAFRKWYKELPDADSLSEGKGLKVILMPWGEGTCPFRVSEKLGEGDSKIYDVHFRDYANLDTPLYQNDYQRDYRPLRQGVWNGSRIRLTGYPGRRIRTTEGDVCVPLGGKILSLKKPDEKKPDGDNDADDRMMQCAPCETEPGPLEPGNLVDLRTLLANQTQPIKLYADGKDVTFNESNRMGKVAALKHLIVEVGLREKTAREILNRAEKAGRIGNDFEFLIEKKAAPGAPIGDMTAGAPNSPPFPEPNIGYDPMTGSNVPTMIDSEFNIKVPDMSASRTDRSIYNPLGPDPRSMQVAQQAAQTGQREVFDTAMLGSLLKAVRQDSMVDRYLGDLMKGMDRLGRILFIFYWRGEEFEERYGKQDMPELEDGLRNAFEGIGDVLFKLKQQSVDANPNEGMDVDLSAIANQ